MEQLNKTYRTEVLVGNVFVSLQAVREMRADGLHRYKHHRSHEGRGWMPSVDYRVKRFPSLCF